jgi:hypothetical protein
VRTLICTCLLASVALAQASTPNPTSEKSAPAASSQNPAQPQHSNANSDSNAKAEKDAMPAVVTLPTDTKVLLVLKNRVSSRNARAGDAVYLESTFPVTQNGRVVIPAGTFVQGTIDQVRRSGRVKGRAEILMHFTTLIYANGYTLTLPGALDSADSQDNQRVKDKEGTVQADSTKGRDAATIATAAGGGTLTGGLTHGLAGAGIGAGIGAAVGVLTTMLTRGDEVILDSGSTISMVFQRPVDFEMDKIDPTNRYVQTYGPNRYRQLQVPGNTRTPTTGPTTFPGQPGVNR